ncbi:MAG: isocitrate lyase/phosphoenolpyruvate mutase family protein [Gammaproteobacteria bacterium]|nr:isocitrate lyase/phosphoenolpyruvate mutase family protein [Gammaproteobacteria bacterium]
MSVRSRLRAAIDAREVVFAPLALDALTARIAEQAGFQAVYLSGGALGYTHAVSEALLTLDELVHATRRVVARSDVAVIADAGVGFGDAVHMTRTIREIEAAGAAAVEIEDQVAPKRVSHHRGIEHLVAPEEMAAKVEHAVRSRDDRDFLVIARTGAVKNESFEDAVRRANLYRDAGADLLMLMPRADEQWAQAPKRIDGPLATISSLDTRRAEAWRDLGWSLVVDPFTTQAVVVDALRTLYGRFMAEGQTGTDRQRILETYRMLSDLAGFAPLYAIEDATTERTP